MCPHQGFIAAGKPGCLLHPLYRGDSARHASFFGEKICDSFLCPAHSIYSDEQKKILIAMLDDWYYYTVAIIDPDSVIWLFNILDEKYGIHAGRDGIMKDILLDFLAIRAIHLQSLAVPLFYYSVPEYRLGFEKFSLGSDSALFDQERLKVLAAIKRLLSSPESPGV